MSESTNRPEALRLAKIPTDYSGFTIREAQDAQAELRRQHAHIAEIEGQRNELVDSVCSLENKVAGLEHLLQVASVKNAELEHCYQWLLARSTESLLNTNPKTWGHCTDADILVRADDAVVKAMRGKSVATHQNKPVPQDSTGAAAVDPAYRWRPVNTDTPRGTKLQLIVRGDGVASYGQYHPGSKWTHWAPLPAFKTGE